MSAVPPAPIPQPVSTGPQPASTGQPVSVASPSPTQPVQAPTDGQRADRRTLWTASALVAAVLFGGIAGFGASYLRPAAEPAPEVTAGPDDALQQSIETIAEKALPTVVMINIEVGAGAAKGSGFFFRKDGYILTNYHVAGYLANDAGSSTEVVLSNGDTYVPTYIGGSESYDIAVIKIDKDDCPLLTLADSDAVRIGQSVIAVGAPLGLQSTVTTGIISAINRPAAALSGQGGVTFYDAFQTDTAINGGNSGGPLLDMDGKVVGINSAGLSPKDGGQLGLNFAIQSNQVRRIAGEIIEKGDATFPWIGATISTDYRGQGAEISVIEPSSPAAKAGLRIGDVITRVDDVPFSDATELIALVRGKTPRDEVTLTISRGSASATEAVTVETEPKPTSHDASISSEGIV